MSSVPVVPLRVSALVVPVMTLPSTSQRVIVGGAPVRLIVNERVAGVGAVLPARSVAATENVWRPAVAPLANASSQDMSGIPSAMQANFEAVSDEAQANAGASELMVSPSAGPADGET